MAKTKKPDWWMVSTDNHRAAYDDRRCDHDWQPIEKKDRAGDPVAGWHQCAKCKDELGPAAPGYSAKEWWG